MAGNDDADEGLSPADSILIIRRSYGVRSSARSGRRAAAVGPRSASIESADRTLTAAAPGWIANARPYGFPDRSRRTRGMRRYWTRRDQATATGRCTAEGMRVGRAPPEHPSSTVDPDEIALYPHLRRSYGM